MEDNNILSEPEITYGMNSSRNLYMLINTTKKGIDFDTFENIALKSPFNMSEWSQYLNLSERTFQRYRKEEKSFDPIYSEKILALTMLFKFGNEVFGSKEKFQTWLESVSVALGGVRPKELLDTSFGIQAVNDELTAIEHGLFA